METPRPQEEEDIWQEDDETAKAYKAIKEQLQQWTSPRLTAAASSPWTNMSAMSGMYDDDDDGLFITKDTNSTLEASAETSRGVSKTPLTSAATSTTPLAEYPYERNVMDWWNRELVDPAPKDDAMGEDDDEIIPATSTTIRLRVTRTPPKSTATAHTRGAAPTVERAATPIMSNSSRKKNKQRLAAASSAASSVKVSPLLHHLEESGDGEDDDAAAMAEDDEMPPVNVQSPWVQQQQQQLFGAAATSAMKSTPGSPWAAASSVGSTGSGIYAATTPRAISPFRNQPYEYRRYHDALLTFLKARRSLSDRIDMDREEQALAMTESSANNALALMPLGSDPALAHEETLVEMDFLRTLKLLCWERDPLSQESRDWRARREGNFWALMGTLRQAGYATLLWADDRASMRQNEQTKSAYWESQAVRIHASPKELLDDLSGKNAPLVLKRRKLVLKWIEQCLDQLVPSETKASVSMAAGGQNYNFANGTGPLTRHLENVMQSCLALILAGRLGDAKLLLRKAGQPWIAAKLGGGDPAGLDKVIDEEKQTVQLVKVGNVNRPLWKRQMWKLSEKMSRNGSDATPSEAAIHSILANDYRNAMENSALRSWEKGMYVLLKALWDRSEDELLHLHNNYRRKARPPFPGTLYERHEKEQLQATCELSSMTEMGVVELLAASPFQAMKGQEHLCGAIASLLIGRSALTDFLIHETDCLANNSIADDELEEKVSRLRFVTHLLLYLDSLSACTTPVGLEGINEYKNHALFAYVDHLANHEDLWSFLVLYASLLPEEVIMDYFPTVLVRVEGFEQRSMMVQQARDLLPGNGLDLTIWKIVVRLILSEEDDMMESRDFEVDLSTPSKSDIRKMKAMEWLCLYEDHYGEALIAANVLLRQFLLINKFASAVMFLQDFLPPEIVDYLMSSEAPGKDEDDEDAITAKELYQIKLGKAKAEHIALQSYLKAVRSFDEWNLCVTNTPFAMAAIDDPVNQSALMESEQEIAQSMERRELIRQKRKVSHLVLTAAETARKDAMSVLLFDGGWLADDVDVGIQDTSEENAQRAQEIQALRSRLLPHAVKLLHQVCEDTAAWMWSSLLDTLPELGSSPKEALEALDDGVSSSSSGNGSDDTLSPLSPRYWTQQALSMAEVVSSDEYLVLQAFDAAELKELLARMSDIALNDLLYSA